MIDYINSQTVSMQKLEEGFMYSSEKEMLGCGYEGKPSKHWCVSGCLHNGVVFKSLELLS